MDIAFLRTQPVRHFKILKELKRGGVSFGAHVVPGSPAAKREAHKHKNVFGLLAETLIEAQRTAGMFSPAKGWT